MRNIFNLGVAAMLGLATLTLGQEVYGTWSHFRALYVNTTAGGANVSETLLNYPLLVRLNSTNFNFALATGNGRDVRFAKTNTLPLKYQIESWDSVNQTASVWVLMDTILGNNVNTAKCRIYYGKSGTADSSNGAAVFSTANNSTRQVPITGSSAEKDGNRDSLSNKNKLAPIAIKPTAERTLSRNTELRVRALIAQSEPAINSQARVIGQKKFKSG